MAIDSKEKDAVLELIQYFGEHWIIFDVGSNKLEWTDVFINYRDGSTEAGKYTIYSFEPNDKLRSYQQVKYDYNNHIKYYSYAIWSTSGEELDFWYWENKNSGLSSVLLNHKWEDELGEFRLHKKVRSLALDDVIDLPTNDAEIDIIKIDVEGAEAEVIAGCEGLMKDKLVKFIQVEYSEHYQWLSKSGASFKSIIFFANRLGYKVWSWDGKYFNEVKAEEFVEDYRAENFIISYIEIGRYEYTQLWNNEFKVNTKNLPKFMTVLEIGCFEGITTNHICDNLLEENGRVICVDPLIDGVYLEGHKDNFIFKGQYERFVKNTKGQPVELIRKTSHETWAELKQYAFDFIFIDGDHRYDAVLEDGNNAYLCCKIYGFILFDDYSWSEETKKAIDDFLEYHLKWGMIKVIIKDYQVLVQKIA